MIFYSPIFYEVAYYQAFKTSSKPDFHPSVSGPNLEQHLFEASHFFLFMFSPLAPVDLFRGVDGMAQSLVAQESICSGAILHWLMMPSERHL